MDLRVLVVDDSMLFRSIVSGALQRIPGVEVVGTASSGRTALARIAELSPDLITLDIEMPGMDGLKVLKELRKTGSDAGVIIVSAVSVHGGNMTVEALAKGAFDFITKPSGSSVDENRNSIYDELAPRVKAFARKREISKILKGGNWKQSVQRQVGAPVNENKISDTEIPQSPKLLSRLRPEMILIGVSTGGPTALGVLLPGIPKDIGVPILIVQHMPPMFTNALAQSLSAKCAVAVREAVSGELLEPGVAYIAPGGKQMRIGLNSMGMKQIIITDDPPENNCRPSVDYLFRSAANCFPGKSTAVILTGMGSDGMLGLRLLKRHGIFVVAQNEATCVVYGMPRAAVEAGVVDEILPLDRIAERIALSVKRGPI